MYPTEVVMIELKVMLPVRASMKVGYSWVRSSVNRQVSVVTSDTVRVELLASGGNVSVDTLAKTRGSASNGSVNVTVTRSLLSWLGGARSSVPVSAPDEGTTQAPASQTSPLAQSEMVAHAPSTPCGATQVLVTELQTSDVVWHWEVSVQAASQNSISASAVLGSVDLVAPPAPVAVTITVMVLLSYAGDPTNTYCDMRV
mmetsp:Transcript_21433/g.30263  ORF Transcript_21433/g.30263 Transcript_21433/m.30263 type:complete len:200 (+) Transcript_21433:137-736(+)